MIKTIHPKQYNDKLVEHFPNAHSHDYILIEPEEIIFLKTKNKVLINKYLSHPNKNDFEFQQEKYSRPYFLEYFSERYNELLEYNKLYLKFEITNDGYRFKKLYFLKDNNQAFYISQSLPLEYGENNIIEKELTKKQLEDFFDINSYDSMYLIDREGYVLFASTKKDQTVIDMNIIPTEKEIINLELHKRENEETLASIFSISDYKEKKLYPKTIDEIKDFPIYGKAMFHGYYNLLVTSKDGKFNVNWLGLDFIEKDKYRLTLGNIPVLEPTINLSEYENQISSAPSPFSDEEFINSLKPKTLKLSK